MPERVAAAAAPSEDRFVREDEVARITGLSRTTRWRLERRGKFPRRRQISTNAVGWSLNEIRAWVSEKMAAPASIDARSEALASPSDQEFVPTAAPPKRRAANQSI